MDRLKKLHEMLENDPKDPFLTYAIALEYMRNGDTGQSLQYFKKLLDNAPNYVPTYFHLGQLYEQIGKHDLAQSTYKKGMMICEQENDQHALGELKEALSLIS